MDNIGHLQQQGINKIGQEVQQALNQGCEQHFDISKYQGVVKKDTFWVGKVLLSNRTTAVSSSLSSVYVKHAPPFGGQLIDELALSYRNEIAGYRFLSSLKDFHFFPTLIADKPGLLVLEDLKLTEKTVTEKDYLRALAVTLAHMHVECSTGLDRYREIQRELQLFSDQNQTSKVCYPSLDHWFGCLEGLKIWREWSSLFANEFDCQALIDELAECLFRPGPFQTFIHSELASTRNMVLCERGMCLLDFECSGVGHALLDIAIPMVGQIHMHRKKKGYFLRHLQADLEFAEIYRAQWKNQGGQTIDEAEWHYQLSLALIFTAALATGSAYRAEQRGNGIEPLSAILIKILTRLLTHLDGLDTMPKLSFCLHTMLNRMSTITA